MTTATLSGLIQGCYITSLSKIYCHLLVLWQQRESEQQSERVMKVTSLAGHFIVGYLLRQQERKSKGTVQFLRTSVLRTKSPVIIGSSILTVGIAHHTTQRYHR